MILAVTITAILSAIAGLHLHWGLGGFWPGRDEASLVDMVIGAPPGTPIPPLWACLIVVACVLIPAAAALLIADGLEQRLPNLFKWIPATALWVSAFVFLARGLATYVSPIFLGGKATKFYQLNIAIYSPLCLALGLGLILVWLFRTTPSAGQ